MSDAMNAAIDQLLESAVAQKIEVEVLASEKRSTAISFQGRKLEKFAVSETNQIGVRVLDGKHEGVAFSESLDRASLEEMLTAARENARMIEKEWISELRGAQKLPAMESLFNPALETVPMEEKIKAASLLEAAALDFNADVQSVAYCNYNDRSGRVWIANSQGLRGDYKLNACMAYSYSLAKDAEGAVVDGEAEASREFERLDTKAIAIRGAEKALARRGATRPQTGTYTIVFENRAAEQLVGLIAGYFSAKAVDESRSPLAGKLGQKVFAGPLTLVDDPLFAQGAGSRPFDEEGYATQKTTLVEDGVVKSFLTNSVLARKMGLPHTASASRAPSTDLDVSTSNVVVKPGPYSLAQLLASDSRVILVTGMLGFAGFRGASGDFSIPMEGFLYEQGKVSAPLKDFLISGNILNLLAAVEGVGNDVRHPLSGVTSPSIMVRGLNVAGRN